MRTHVSFEADTRDAPDAAPPRGSDLLDELVAALRGRGGEIDAPQPIDYAFEFWIRYQGGRFYAAFGEVDDGVRQWLLSAEVPGLRLQRLFGRRDEASHHALLGAIHQALSTNPRVRSIRWYEREDWNSAPDEGWHPDPAA